MEAFIFMQVPSIYHTTHFEFQSHSSLIKVHFFIFILNETCMYVTNHITHTYIESMDLDQSYFTLQVHSHSLHITTIHIRGLTAWEIGRAHV